MTKLNWSRYRPPPPTRQDRLAEHKIVRAEAKAWGKRHMARHTAPPPDKQQPSAPRSFLCPHCGRPPARATITLGPHPTLPGALSTVISCSLACAIRDAAQGR